MTYSNKGGNGEVVQAIKAHFDIASYMEHRGYSFKQKGRELYCNELSGFCIEPTTQKFYDHKSERGGSIIDLVMHLDSISLPNAISLLRKEMSTYNNSQTKIDYKDFKRLNEEKSDELKLPPKLNGKYTRVFAYLTKSRGIEGKIVSNIVSRKMLYEDGKYHNCVFVGYDYDKKAKFACTRRSIDKSMLPKYLTKDLKLEAGQKLPSGLFLSKDQKSLIVSRVNIKASVISALVDNGLSDIQLFYKENDVANKVKSETTQEIRLSSFSGSLQEVSDFKVSSETHKQVTEPFIRGDIENSIKEVAWFVDNNSTSLFVCEAPIDAMSIMSLLHLGGKDYNQYSYLAQSGCSSTSSLLYHIKNNPNINKVYLCYDSDKAGQEALIKATNELKQNNFKGTVIHKIPKSNDFNDDLISHRKQTSMTYQQNTIIKQEVAPCVSH